MKRCPQCAEEIQEAARVCKHCGKQVRTSRAVTCIAVLLAPVLLVFFVTLALQELARQKSPPAAPPPKKPAVDQSPAMQNRREALLKKLMRSGIIKSVELSSPGVALMTVRAPFYALDFEAKQQFASLVYAYFFDGTKPLDGVVLLDSLTGKTIGHFDPSMGLRLE